MEVGSDPHICCTGQAICRAKKNVGREKKEERKKRKTSTPNCEMIDELGSGLQIMDAEELWIRKSQVMPPIPWPIPPFWERQFKHTGVGGGRKERKKQTTTKNNPPVTVSNTKGPASLSVKLFHSEESLSSLPSPPLPGSSEHKASRPGRHTRGGSRIPGCRRWSSVRSQVLDAAPQHEKDPK